MTGPARVNTLLIATNASLWTSMSSSKFLDQDAMLGLEPDPLCWLRNAVAGWFIKPRRNETSNETSSTGSWSPLSCNTCLCTSQSSSDDKDVYDSESRRYYIEYLGLKTNITPIMRCIVLITHPKAVRASTFAFLASVPPSSSSSGGIADVITPWKKLTRARRAYELNSSCIRKLISFICEPWIATDF